MRPAFFWITALVAAMLALSGCAVISQRVRAEAYPPIAFQDLLQHPDAYRGRTVILGGYVIKTRNLEDKTLLFVLQSPLGLGQEPGAKDASQGRFMVSVKGFLDPEVYTKDRCITVAGTVVGSRVERDDQIRYRYPVLESIEIHLWPKYENLYPYPYYDPWFYGFYGWGPYFYSYPSSRYYRRY